MSRDESALYFWHIPKTAGSSLTEWIDSHFRTEQIFQPHLLPQLAGVDQADLRDKRLFRGHFGAELPARHPGPLTCVTVLREPRSRTVSHLAHIWRAPDHYLHARLQHLGGVLSDALDDPVIRASVGDMQARYLGTAPSTSSLSESALAELDVPDDLRAQVRFELAPLPGHRTLRRRALHRLARLSLVGSTDRVDDLARRLAARRGWPAPQSVPRANTAAPDSSPWTISRLSPAELDLLDSVNRTDHVLYRWVCDGQPQPRRLLRRPALRAR